MAVTWLLAGGCLLWVGIKAENETLPRNELVGIRTPTLLASDEAWTTGHKAASSYLRVSSIPPFIGFLTCFFLSDSAIAWFSLSVAGLLLILVLMATQKAQSAVKER